MVAALTLRQRNGKMTKTIETFFSNTEITSLYTHTHTHTHTLLHFILRYYPIEKTQFSSVQSLSCVQLFATHEPHPTS